MEASLARPGTANYENIFVNIVLGVFVPAYHNTFGLSKQDVLVKRRCQVVVGKNGKGEKSSKRSKCIEQGGNFTRFGG